MVGTSVGWGGPVMLATNNNVLSNIDTVYADASAAIHGFDP